MNSLREVLLGGPATDLNENDALLFDPVLWPLQVSLASDHECRCFGLLSFHTL